MGQNYKYFAFISYKREDEEWAKWLQHKLEHYRLPLKLREKNPELPKEIRPLFRDKSELSGGVLANVINDALENSKYLIVICSPRAAKSEWVCKEVQTFIDLGRTEKIIPFIIGGTPHSANPDDECFPTSLLNLPKEQELLAININEMGRDAAAIKVAAQMFCINFDTLWQRYEREKKRKLWTFFISILLFAFLCIIVGSYIIRQNVKLNLAYKEISSQKTHLLTTNKSLNAANDSIRLQEHKLIEANKELLESNKIIAKERDNVSKANWNFMKSQSRAVVEVEPEN